MKCPRCGKEIADDSIYCNYCKKKIVENNISLKEWLKKYTILWIVLGSVLYGIVAGGIISYKFFYLKNQNERLDVIDGYRLTEPMCSDSITVTSESRASEAQRTAEIEKAKAEAENAKAEAARAQAEAEKAKTKAELEKAKIEAEAKAKAEFEAKVKAEAEAKAKAEFEAKAKAEAEAKAKVEAEAKAKVEEDSIISWNTKLKIGHERSLSEIFYLSPDECRNIDWTSSKVDIVSITRWNNYVGIKAHDHGKAIVYGRVNGIVKYTLFVFVL